MSYSEFSAYIPRCQHIKTNGTQCGSPALHRRRLCFFHNRWLATSIKLQRASTASGDANLQLPLLEDADSIQVALMQVLQLILNRQLDSKIGGLMLYGLQIGSSNLRHANLEPRCKTTVIIDPRSVSNTGVGDDPWDREDFEGADDEDDDDDNDNSTATTVAQKEPKPAPEAKGCVARTCPERQSKELSPAPAVTPNPARKPSTAAAELQDLQRIDAALQGAEQGNLRDLKAVFKFAGIYPPKAAPEPKSK